jgi:protein SCO1/2
MCDRNICGLPARWRDFYFCARVPLLGLLLLFGRAATAGAQSEVTAAQLSGDGIEQRLNSQVPLDLRFRDANGQTVALSSYFDKEPVILSMIYYTCQALCPLTEHALVNSLRNVKANMGQQYQVVTVSIDPTDTPELAKSQKDIYLGLYARPGSNQGWHFLVGDHPSIRALASAVGLPYQYMAHMGEFDHVAGIVILTPTGRVSRYFLGINYPAAEVQTALTDASNEKIGNTVGTMRVRQERIPESQ